MISIVVFNNVPGTELDYGFGSSGMGTYIRDKKGRELAFIPDPETMASREKAILKGREVKVK